MNEINQEETTVRLLYKNLLQYWNNADAKGYARLFADDANLIGFDGSQVNGSAEIEKHLAGIFANHKTASYISIVREVRFLAPEVAVLCAVAGMVPGKTDINPATNAIQTAVFPQNRFHVPVSGFSEYSCCFSMADPKWLKGSLMSSERPWNWRKMPELHNREIIFNRSDTFIFTRDKTIKC